MKEAEIEKHFVYTVAKMGGRSYKFKSMNHRGVSDQVACLPGGVTWFVELKQKGGKLSPLQKIFADDVQELGQNYACLWSIEHINQWRKENEPK